MLAQFAIILQICAALLFLFGLLSSRDQLPDQSDPNDFVYGKPRKVIMLIVDGVRADLAIREEFRFFKELLEDSPSQAQFFVAHTAFPTLTSQSILQITIGNFQSFFSIRANLKIFEVQEDNIIGQMHKKNQSIVLAGLSIFSHIYQNYIHTAYIRPDSDHNIFDYSTLDSLVYSNIPNHISTDESLVIGHFAGVDNIGHTLGFKDVSLAGTLSQYDAFIRNVYNEMDDDTVLLVCSDHGQTIGDLQNHGGNTEGETTSFVFAAVKGRNKLNYKHTQLMMENLERFQFFETRNSSFVDREKYSRYINIIDLAPTLAYFLGLPIPFSNVGAIIPELIIGKDNPFIFCQQNMKQMWKYLSTLQGRYKTFSSEKFAAWKSKYEEVKSLSDNQLNILKIQDFMCQIQKEVQQDLLYTKEDGTLFVAMVTQLILVAFNFFQITVYHRNQVSKSTCDISMNFKRQILVKGTILGCVILSILKWGFECHALFLLSVSVMLVSLFLLINTIFYYYSMNHVELVLMDTDQQIDLPQTEQSYIQILFSQVKSQKAAWILLSLSFWLVYRQVFNHIKEQNFDHYYFTSCLVIFLVMIVAQIIQCKSISAVPWQVGGFCLSQLLIFLLLQFDNNDHLLLNKQFQWTEALRSQFIQFWIPGVFLYATTCFVLLLEIKIFCSDFRDRLITRAQTLLAILAITLIYYYHYNNLPNEQTFVPRTIYFLASCGIVANFFKVQQYKNQSSGLFIIVRIIQVQLIVLVVQNQQSLAQWVINICALGTSLLAFHFRAYVFDGHLPQNKILMTVYFGFFFPISMYFYYEVTNHRADFGRINYQMGLVGFPDFNLIAAPTLLMLSQLGNFFSTIFLQRYFTYFYYGNDEFSFKRSKILTQIHFSVILWLVELYSWFNFMDIDVLIAPYIFNFAIFMAVTISTLISF